jgi:hypothetical protein
MSLRRKDFAGSIAGTGANVGRDQEQSAIIRTELKDFRGYAGLVKIMRWVLDVRHNEGRKEMENSPREGLCLELSLLS